MKLTGARQAAVAGVFYPDEAICLAQAIQAYLPPVTTPAAVPKAIVAPHAGYVYSGAIAGTVYAQLQAARETIRRVVLLGPSHRVPLRGMALPEVAWFQTPLGNVPIDQPLQAQVQALPGVLLSDHAHALEHSLEVHLPFLQTVLHDFTLLPLVLGQTQPEQVAAVLDCVWGGAETLIVVSSDLSHYLTYAAACVRDKRTSEAIVALDYASMVGEDACGVSPLKGLLMLAKRKGMQVQALDVRNSGDTAGDKSRVVGYGAYAFYSIE